MTPRWQRFARTSTVFNSVLCCTPVHLVKSSSAALADDRERRHRVRVLILIYLKRAVTQRSKLPYDVMRPVSGGDQSAHWLQNLQTAADAKHEYTLESNEKSHHLNTGDQHLREYQRNNPKLPGEPQSQAWIVSRS